jgi:hypothetical protein
MQRVLAFSLVCLLSVPLSSVPAAAAGQGGPAGSISGAARNASGRVLARTTVQLRNVTTGQLAGTSTSNGAGTFTFAGLQPATYVVEVVNAAGAIIGTSTPIAVAAGAVVIGVGVTASALVAAAGGTFIASTAGLLTLAAAGAGVAAVTVAANRTTASASQ